MQTTKDAIGAVKPKQALEDAATTQIKLALALAAGKLGAWDLDLNTARFWRSYEHDRIFGYPTPAPEWTIGTLLDHVVAEDKNHVERELTRACATGYLDIECRIARADRAIRWIALRGAILDDELKTRSRMTGVIQDIDDRKQAEERLRQVEARHRMLMNGVRDYGIYMLDTGGHIITWNQSAQRQKGYGPDETLGRDISIFYSAEDRAAGKPKADLERAAREGETVVEDWRYRKDGSRFWAEVVITALRDENGVLHGFSKFTRDLTEKKKAEEDLLRSNAELEQFAYVASHDLQEPLRMVASFTQLLAQRYKGKLDKDADDFIGFAVDGAKRMQHLIEDLLSYSRVGTRVKEFRLCDANVMVRNALQQLTVSVEESSADVQVSALPQILCDDVQMTSVFQNLIGNAIKFRRPGEPPVVKVSAEQAGDRCIFHVSDNGIGIESRHFDRVFQVFQRLQTRESYAGNGIGLAICKKTVERHGGKIWLESQPGSGTTFLFSIPCKTGATEKEMERNDAYTSSAG